MHPLYYEFFLRNKSRLTSEIGLHMLYMLFQEGVLDQSAHNTCELLATRKERNDYLFDFYLGRVSLNGFLTFLRSPDSNVDSILLEYIEAEIAALHVLVKRRRKTSPKRLTSPKNEAVAEGELRDLLKKLRTIPIVTLPYVQERDTPPVAGSSLLPMSLPSPPPQLYVERHPPSLGDVAQQSPRPSPPIRYPCHRRQKLPHNHHACYHHHHHTPYQPVLRLRH